MLDGVLGMMAQVSGSGPYLGEGVSRARGGTLEEKIAFNGTGGRYYGLVPLESAPMMPAPLLAPSSSSSSSSGFSSHGGGESAYHGRAAGGHARHDPTTHRLEEIKVQLTHSVAILKSGTATLDQVSSIRERFVGHLRSISGLELTEAKKAKLTEAMKIVLGYCENLQKQLIAKKRPEASPYQGAMAAAHLAVRSRPKGHSQAPLLG